MRNPFLWAQEIQTPFLPLQRHGRLRLFQVLSANITYHHFSLSVAKLRWSVVFFLRLLTGYPSTNLLLEDIPSLNLFGVLDFSF